MANKLGKKKPKSFHMLEPESYKKSGFEDQAGNF